MILKGDSSQGELERYYSDVMVQRFEEMYILVEMNDEGTWKISALGRIGTAGPDLRCN